MAGIATAWPRGRQGFSCELGAEHCNLAGRMGVAPLPPLVAVVRWWASRPLVLIQPARGMRLPFPGTENQGPLPHRPISHRSRRHSTLPGTFHCCPWHCHAWQPRQTWWGGGGGWVGRREGEIGCAADHDRGVHAQRRTKPAQLPPLQRSVVCAAAICAACIAHWLAWAYALEFQGRSVHAAVWLAGILLLAAETWLLRTLMRSVPLEDGRNAARKAKQL